MPFWELTPPPPGVTLDKTACVPVFWQRRKKKWVEEESLIFGHANLCLISVSYVLV